MNTNLVFHGAVFDAASIRLRRPVPSMVGAAPDRAALRFDRLAVVS